MVYPEGSGKSAVLKAFETMQQQSNYSYVSRTALSSAVIVAELVASVALFSAYSCLIKQRSNTLHTPSPSRS